MTEVEFVFIRHAQATHNVAAETRGESAYYDPVYRDAELTDEGHLQVSRARRERGAEFLKPSGGLAPDAIYCSPLHRCRQTLLGVVPASAEWPVHLDDRLMEPQSHVCNHRIEKDALIHACPDTWDMTGVAAVNPQDAPDSVVARIRAFTTDMVTRHPGQRVLVVSHFTWISNWFRIFKQEVVAPPNCGILRAVLPVAAAGHKKLD